MWLGESPWQLPSTHRLLEQICSSRFDGGAWVILDPRCPEGLPQALVAQWNGSGGVLAEQLVDWQGSAPAAAISDAWGVRSDDVGALVSNTGLTDQVLVVDLRDATADELEGWQRFLRRVSKAVGEVSYWAIVAIAHQDADVGLARIDGRGVIRRLDARLWAGLRLRSGFEPPIDLLAESLAVELGCLDLDFTARIAGAGYEELLDAKRHFHDEWKSCVSSRGEQYSLAAFESAAWRGQVQALFPWLEERRHEVVALYRKWLSIDEAQIRLGVDDIAQIELGGIARQLHAKVPVQERDYLWALSRVRNALAHRCLAPPDDLERALRAARKRQH